MKTAAGFLYFIIIGVIIAELARLVGSRVFKFSSIYGFLYKTISGIRGKNSNNY